MRVTERRFGEAAILELHGDIVGPHANELLQISVRNHLLSASRVVILDMREVGAIDREGLDALASVAGTVRQQEAELRVVGRQDQLTDPGALEELHGTVRHFESVEDALGEVRQALERKHASSAGAHWSLTAWDKRLRRLFRCQ